ncbi:MAG: cupin domain-containing protein [Candidatus Eisenbacteria bacterium]|nr:cupin domain-containing protein [Candidatus Eisenbacteria bacterium]
MRPEEDGAKDGSRRGAGPSAKAMEQLAERIRALEAEGYVVEPWIVPAGSAYRNLISNQDKILAVLSGTLRLQIPGEERVVEAGETIAVPHGAGHTVTAQGEEDVYIMLARRDPPPIPPHAFGAEPE